MTAAYINLLDVAGGGVSNIDRRGLILFNTTGVDLLVNPNNAPADATSYTVPAGQSFDFTDQPPIANLYVKAASGNLLVWEA